MHIAVIGAGITGVTTAFYLAQQGCRVTLIESASAVGTGASFANGAQLSYSYADPLAKPQMLKLLPGLLAGKDSSSVVRLDPALISWGLKFLLQCTAKQARANLLSALDITSKSQKLIDDLVKQIPIECHKLKAGKLVLLNSKAAIALAQKNALLKQRAGFNTQVVSFEQAIDIEPALKHFSEPPLGALYSPDDSVADAHAFCTGLADWLENHTETRLMTSTKVVGLELSNPNVKEVLTTTKTVNADAIVVCAGAWSRQLLRPAGLRLPIYPIRGYSVTLPAAGQSPRLSITDPQARIVISPLGNQMRIAGFADFKGFDTSTDTVRCKRLVATAQEVAPESAEFSSSIKHEWGGFRPMTPNGLPLVGPTSLPRVFLNTGHGMLGWTMACATGDTVAHQIGAIASNA